MKPVVYGVVCTLMLISGCVDQGEKKELHYLQGDHQIFVVDASANKIMGEIWATEYGVRSFILTPKGDKIYANFTIGDIHIIDTSTCQVVGKIISGEGDVRNMQLLVDQFGRNLYQVQFVITEHKPVTGAKGFTRIRVVDLENTSKSVNVNLTETGLALLSISADSKRAYGFSHSSREVKQGKLMTIDIATGKTMEVVEIPKPQGWDKSDIFTLSFPVVWDSKIFIAIAGEKGEGFVGGIGVVDMATSKVESFEVNELRDDRWGYHVGKVYDNGRMMYLGGGEVSTCIDLTKKKVMATGGGCSEFQVEISRDEKKLIIGHQLVNARTLEKMADLNYDDVKKLDHK